MPDMANIVVKAFNGTTDVTYTKQQPSAGDNQPAIWKDSATGTVPAGNPILKVVARDNGQKKARRISGSYLFPKVRTDAGNTVVNGGISGEFALVVPQDMTQTEINEACFQYANLIASALIKSSFVTGYSPS